VSVGECVWGGPFLLLTLPSSPAFFPSVFPSGRYFGIKGLLKGARNPSSLPPILLILHVTHPQRASTTTTGTTKKTSKACRQQSRIGRRWSSDSPIGISG